MMKKRRLLPALAIAAALVAVAPAVPAMAAPSVESARIVPAACSWKTQYRWQDFTCWMILGGTPPARCYYRVYTCS